MSGVWHGGKGSSFRKVDTQKYNNNWDAVFGPIVVEWKGKPGYGDMCSAVGYVNNLAQKTGKKVRLEWTSFNGFLERLDPVHEHPDSEDTNDRLYKIFDMMKTENVELKIRYNENLPYQHSKLPNDPLYFYRYMKPEYKWQGGGGYIVFNTTENNYVQWKDYKNPKHKTWKSPDTWDNTYQNFDNVRFVDYTTPLETLIDILKGCELFVGYAGGVAQLAQTMRVPMFLYVNEIKRALGCCPAAVISKRLTFKQEDIPMIQSLALENIAECEELVKSYINSTSNNEDVLDGEKENTETERETGT
jgi:hypothetical protein